MPSGALGFINRVNTRTERQLGRVANAANISREDLRELIEAVVDEHLGLVPRERLKRPGRKTGARCVNGESHAALSYIADPDGTDIVPPEYEPPPGYRGP
jgi:hypothetical protein